jgi:hypothetical protein
MLVRVLILNLRGDRKERKGMLLVNTLALELPGSGSVEPLAAASSASNRAMRA